MIPLLIACVVVTVSAQINPNQGNIPCGVPTVQPHTKRIVGGTVATPGSWPWTVLLVDDLGFITGSGVLIHPNVILTSAQHFEGPGYTLYDLDLRFWRAYCGEYNISTTDPHEKYYHIRRVVLHPGYNFTSLENDIAIVILSQPVIYNAHTRPACLPDSAHTYSVGMTCWLPGWGSTEKTGNEEVLNQVDLPILADSVCQSIFPGYLPNTELCAGYQNAHKDWCVDDIGSPLMCKDANGAWYIQGLASSGGNCTVANQPSVFEDVSKYSSFVKTTMEDAGYPYQY